MAGSSFTGPLKIKKSDGTKVTFVDASGDIVAGTTIEFGDGDTLSDTNGNELMEFTVTASAVNHLGVVNSATGDSPILRAEGEANTGIVFDNSEAEEILILNSVATSVNEFTISSAATGNGPILAATGETNVDINISPKGTGIVQMNSPVGLTLSGGAVSASGLLAGVGTTANPATTATADAKFIEVRAETTATSGDNRLMYLRYSLNGTTGGECIRAFTKLEAAGTTVRGAHVSLDVAATGSASGLGIGVDNQILVHNGALTGGTYSVINSEIYSAGSSTDVSGVTSMSFFRAVAGGDGTGAANVDDNAFLMDFSGIAAGSGNIIDTNITTHTAYGGLKVNIPGVGTRWIALVSA